MRLILRRVENKTSLLAAHDAPAGGCKIEIQKASFPLKTSEPNPSIRDAHRKHLLQGNFPTYYLNLPRIDWFTTADGTYRSMFNVGSDLRKNKTILIGVIPQASRLGELLLSAFRFHNQQFGVQGEQGHCRRSTGYNQLQHRQLNTVVQRTAQSLQKF